ncbi:hypothetical protein GY45DRAFT_1259252 [Cubamyces sp. BRFM 1775]|nr:hypothetical protein GY45DRAFT_1259252 [Cubamyces sp. BRFM 1775]
MHLMFENVLKNLMLLWTGGYKGLDTGSEDYQLPPTVWEAIGEASALAGDTIPSAFGPRPPNVAKDNTSWTADLRSFWALYLGPVLLTGRFTHRRYYEHFVLLVQLIHRCLQFEISTGEVDEIRTGFIKWVRQYEKIYYQGDPARLSTCPLTIHALLHIADSIMAAGPVWTSWAFPMERYCGSLQRSIRSRRFPFASLNRYVLDKARLTQVKHIYDLGDALRLAPPDLEGFYGGACILGYQTCALLTPRRPDINASALERGLLTKLVGALITRFGGTIQATHTALRSAQIEEWGRIRILPDGDTIRAASAQSLAGGDSGPTRDASYVRYEALVDRNARSRNAAIQLVPKTFYGQLQRILVLHCPPIPSSTHSALTPLIFAVIRTCKITADHPTLDIHYYSRDSSTDLVDITTVQCLVGRVRDRNQWAIIDRSGTLSRALYEGHEAGDAI